MAFDIGVGGGQRVTVREPERGQFSDNLGGALQFTFAEALYKIMESMGGALGSFGAGVLVQFMERVEPSLVEYTRPLIDFILDQEGLDPHIRTFFEQLREPVHEGASAVLGGMASQVGGAGLTNILNVVMAPAAQFAMRTIRPTLPSVAEALTMWRRGQIKWDKAALILAQQGYPDDIITAYGEITKSRAGVGDLVTGVFRGAIKPDEYQERMKQYGFEDLDIDLFLRTAQAKPDVGEIIRGWFRKELRDEDVVERLGQLGYDGADIQFLLSIARPIPGAGDLIRMGVREAFRDDIAAKWAYDEDFPPNFEKYMRLQGYDPVWAKYYWRAHWTLPSVSQSFEMYHRRVIDEPTLQTFLRVSDIPAFWREKLTDISYRTLTRVDIRRMYGLGVLDRDGVYESYLDYGYSPENAEAMTEFTVRYETKEGESKIEEYRDLTRSVITQAYKKGVITRDQAVTRLMEIGYLTEDIDVLLSLADWEQELDETPDYMSDYQRDIKSIVERAYSERVLSTTEATSILTEVGYSPTEATYILTTIDFWWGLDQTGETLKTVGEAYQRRGLTRQDALTKLSAFGLPSDMMQQKLAEWDVQREIRSRRLTESQYRRALNEGIIGQAEYIENMKGLGYTDYDIWVLLAMAVGREEAGPPPQTGPLPLGDRG